MTAALSPCNDLEWQSGDERDSCFARACTGCPEVTRLEIESEEMSMKKKLEVKIRKLEKIETTINRGGASG
ncbi:hypothetical protein [Nonomuraea sp. NPDC050202]|uniref:hypothetical protein n=1 Tax=Nonomuraea sp. NPDC050202 TaxID=3155035 RepID=UPI0033D1A204